MFAIWLLFSNKDTVYIEKIISALNLKFNLPNFIPHITIFGLVDSEKGKIVEIIKKNIHKVIPFTVKMSKINLSEDNWKSLFIEIEKNENLILMNNKFNQEFKKSNDNRFFPHLSLMYNFNNETEKRKIIETLKIKKEFKVERISILKFSNNVNEWKIIETFKL